MEMDREQRETNLDQIGAALHEVGEFPGDRVVYMLVEIVDGDVGRIRMSATFDAMSDEFGNERPGTLTIGDAIDLD